MDEEITCNFRLGLNIVLLVFALVHDYKTVVFNIMIKVVPYLSLSIGLKLVELTNIIAYVQIICRLK